MFLDSEQRLRLPLRLLLYFVAYFVLVVALQAVTEAIPAPMAARRLVFLVLVVPLLAGMTWVFRRWLDRRSWEGIGLSGPGAGLLLAGCLAGFGLVGLITLVEWSAGWRDVVGAWDPWLFLMSFAASLGVGFAEEVAFRGYFLANLGERLPLWLVALITGLVFGALHLQSAPAAWAPGVITGCVVITFLFTAVRVGTGSLWAAIGLHWGWNWSQGHLYEALQRSGPELMVGPAGFHEVGLVSTGITLVATVLVAWGLRRQIRWSRAFSPGLQKTSVHSSSDRDGETT
ncbi:CPBP family intramembrane glutamic endopeptidase [Acrocarpospora catenulata]|uniref:CPBP family intramembrane glutamic endopeptidase n=1 Tax=Acrocarpospora catenulata TaxID=2836182 RepID=UPI001BD930BE|nr:CPBP family intramembrane glutamic endopeptidase [Acrocarpospora catenulata]